VGTYLTDIGVGVEGRKLATAI